MTGYKSKLAAAQDKITDEQGRPMTYWGGKAQPAQDSNWAWACNECGTQEFTSALSEADLDYLACSTCGGNEFHKEALAQPVQEPVAFAGIEIWVGNARIAKYLTQTELHYARDPWMLMQYSAEMCISKLKEKNT